MVANLNASLLSGLSATALQTRVTQYTVPNGKTPVTNATFALPGLRAGDYVASIDISAVMTAPGENIDCDIEPAGTEDAVVMGYGSSYSQYSTVSASRAFHLAPGAKLTLHCFTNTTTFKISGPTTTVDFVKIDGITARAARLTQSN